jgi:hypothetical protein
MAAPIQPTPEVEVGQSAAPPEEDPVIDIKPLLKKMWPANVNGGATADEIAQAISYFFTHQVSDVQAASLLIALHFTGLDRQPDVLERAAHYMRQAAAKIDTVNLTAVSVKKNLQGGGYRGGLVRFHFSFSPDSCLALLVFLVFFSFFFFLSFFVFYFV